MKTAPVWLSLLLPLLGCNSGPPQLQFTLDEHWPERSSYPGVGAGRVLVTNSLEDTVSLLDASRIGQPDFAELARVPVGLIPVEIEGPHHAAIDPSGEYFYVGISNYAPGTGSGPHGAHGTGTADGHLLKVRSADNHTVATVRVDRNPGDLAISPDGKTVYVTHFDLLRITEVQARGGSASEMDSRLAIIDAESMTRRAMVPVCPAAHGVKVARDGKKIFVACYSDEVAIVDSEPPHAVRRIALTAAGSNPTAPVHQPYALTLPEGSSEVWVSCLEEKDLHVLDPSTEAFDPARRLRLLGAPFFGDSSPDGTLLFFPRQGEDGVTVVRAATGERVREHTLPNCERPHALLRGPDPSLALVVCEGDHRARGALAVFELATGAVIQTVSVGVFPDYVGLIPGGDR